jgi:hypothetical protein
MTDYRKTPKEELIKMIQFAEMVQDIMMHRLEQYAVELYALKTAIIELDMKEAVIAKTTDKEWFTKCMEEYVSDRDEMEWIIAKLDDETLEKTMNVLAKAIKHDTGTDQTTRKREKESEDIPMHLRFVAAPNGRIN